MSMAILTSYVKLPEGVLAMIIIHELGTPFGTRQYFSGRWRMLSTKRAKIVEFRMIWGTTILGKHHFPPQDQLARPC